MKIKSLFLSLLFLASAFLSAQEVSFDETFALEDYNFVLGENNFFFYEDQYGSLKTPKPSIKGDFQLENASTYSCRSAPRGDREL